MRSYVAVAALTVAALFGEAQARRPSRSPRRHLLSSASRWTMPGGPVLCTRTRPGRCRADIS